MLVHEGQSHDNSIVTSQFEGDVAECEIALIVYGSVAKYEAITNHFF